MTMLKLVLALILMLMLMLVRLCHPHMNSSPRQSLASVSPGLSREGPRFDWYHNVEPIAVTFKSQWTRLGRCCQKMTGSFFSHTTTTRA
jgi:hypothetical protein